MAIKPFSLPKPQKFKLSKLNLSMATTLALGGGGHQSFDTVETIIADKMNEYF